MNGKPETAFVSITRTEGLIVGGLMVAVALPLGLLIEHDRGWIAGTSAGAFVALVKVARPVRKERWFWAATLALVALNVFAIFWVDWSFTRAWTGRTIAGLMIINLSLMMAVIYGLFCLKYGKPTEIVAELPASPRYSERDIGL